MKKLIFAGLLFLTTCGFAVDSKLELYDFTGGLLDVVTPERMPSKYTPDMGNVALDKDLGIVRRLAYTDLNATEMTGLQQVMSGCDYKQVSGSQYFVAESSNSLFYSSDGAVFSVLKTSFTIHSHQTYEIANDVLWGGNGVDAEWSWNGTTFTSYTVSNSTNMVKAKLHCWHKNRMFRAGVPGNPLTLYYSNINTTPAGAPVADPADLGDGSNWDYIPEAGDYITALRRSVTGDYLYIFTTNSTYQLVGDDPASWRLVRINPFIGCLYDSTADYLGNNLMLLSSRGIEAFDGMNYTLKSAPIDNQIKELKQINVGSLGLSQDSASDWGAGNGVNTDTATYSGSVATAVISSTTYISEYSMTSLYYEINTGSDFRQKFCPGQSFYFNAIKSYAYYSDTGGKPRNFDYIKLCDKSMNVLSVATMTVELGRNDVLTYTFSDKYNLVSGTTYYLWYDHALQGATGESQLYVRTSSPIYTSSYEYHASSALPSHGWTASAGPYSYIAFTFMYSTNTASYTTQSMGNTNWGTWGSIVIDDFQPSGSFINYYAVTATSTYNLGTNAAFPITDNAQINSSVGPYIKIISSFTKTGAFTVTPMVNSYNITYYGTDWNYPCGKTFNESYYFSCATNTTNSVVYRYNKNGIFELYTNMYANCFMKYRGELYFGSSQDTGKIYRMNVPGLYADSLSNYRSWYYTPMLNCTNPIFNKNFKWLYVTSSRDTQPFSIKYQIDNATSTWKVLNPILTPNRVNVQKIPFPASTTGRYIQLLLETTSYMNVQGMSLIYEELPL